MKNQHTGIRYATHSRGFTLIEVVVAVGVFTLLIGTVMGVFVSLARGQRSGFAQTTILGDAETFLELLEREVRTGYGSTFGGGGSTFTFTNQEGDAVTYSRVNTAIQRNAVSITSPAVAVSELDFFPVQAARNDNVLIGDPTDDFLGGFADNDQGNRQGRVRVRIRACPREVAGTDTDARCIFVQTTLTSRQYAPP